MFYGTFVFLLSCSFILALKLPVMFPWGGPDEPMHISLVKYIATYWEWPSWDSYKLLRYINGQSYSTGSSIVYWIHAVFLKLTGHNRFGAVLLFTVLLGFLWTIYRRNKDAGLFGLSLITPQCIFIFSYVNGDTGTIIVAFFLGVASACYLSAPEKKHYFYFFMLSSAACMTGKFHVWAVGFVVFAAIAIVNIRYIVRLPVRHIVTAGMTSLLIASWWPVTSYFANDGDMLGFTAQKKAMAVFGDPAYKLTTFDLDAFPFKVFLTLLMKSFYGVWGWMRCYLPDPVYVAAFLLVAVQIILLLIQMKRRAALLIALMIFNVLLVVIYSTGYDFQPQGRYLFPSYFILIGFSVSSMAFHRNQESGKTVNDISRIVSIVLIALNIFAILVLGKSYILPDVNHVKRVVVAPLKTAQENTSGQRHSDNDLIIYCRELLKRNPRHVDAMLNLGFVYNRRGEYEKAYDYLMDAHSKIDLYSLPSAALNIHLGYSLQKQSQFMPALRHYLEGLRLNPDYGGDVYCHVALLLGNQGMRDDCLYWSALAKEKSYLFCACSSS